ncbi:MAG: diacylglycerol kinase family protein [Actinomycetota bacterium]
MISASDGKSVSKRAKRIHDAVMIINPNAGRFSAEQAQRVIDHLNVRLRTQVLTTGSRDVGIELATEAASAGVPLVIAFGGDGHVNEVANGVAGTDSALGVIPGGTMNVFARALGIPLDPIRAADELLAALDTPERVVPLGRMDDRYFTFSAGCGFDAEAAERVERDIPAKRRFGELFFYWSAFRVLAGSYRYRNPSMMLEGPFGKIPVAMTVASNTGPYAYLAGRSINLAPEVELEGGLDVFALKRMRLESFPLYAWRSIFSGQFIDHPDSFYRHDLTSLDVYAETPFARHVDGEPLKPKTSTHFELVPGILKVRA